MTFIATLFATGAFVGGLQVLSPSPAAAAIAECRSVLREDGGGGGYGDDGGYGDSGTDSGNGDSGYGSGDSGLRRDGGTDSGDSGTSADTPDSSGTDAGYPPFDPNDRTTAAMRPDGLRGKLAERGRQPAGRRQ